MKLGYSLGLSGFEPIADARRCQLAEVLGFSTVWVAESTGPDAFTVAAWVVARTSTIGVATGVAQAFPRSPAITAMSAAGLALISGGRFRLGLGASSPDILDRVHGIESVSPLTQMVEYLAAVRGFLRGSRERLDGRHYPIPLRSGGDRGRLLPAVVPADVPIIIAANGPRMAGLSADHADGLLTLFHTPASFVSLCRPLRPRGTHSTSALVPLILTDDVAGGISLVRPVLARYIGVGGDQNPYFRLAVRLGFAEEARDIRGLMAAGRRDEAAAAVPAEWVDESSLIGPPSRLSRKLAAWAGTGVDELVVATGQPESLEVLAGDANAVMEAPRSR